MKQVVLFLALCTIVHFSTIAIEPSLSQSTVKYPGPYPMPPIDPIPPVTSPSSGGSLKLLNYKPEDREKRVVAVIVTMRSGGSYDRLFT
jgi:hypothetical protein